jgi:hypothetical protein
MPNVLGKTLDLGVHPGSDDGDTFSIVFPLEGIVLEHKMSGGDPMVERCSTTASTVDVDEST